MTAHLCSICQLPVIAAGKTCSYCPHVTKMRACKLPCVAPDDVAMQQTMSQQCMVHGVLHLSHKSQQCCVVMLAGLEQAGRMRSGETVLVTAAAGGTGQFAVQLAKMAGNQVVATCGSDDKAHLLTDLGCDRVINYNKEQPKVVRHKSTRSKTSNKAVCVLVRILQY